MARAELLEQGVDLCRAGAHGGFHNRSWHLAGRQLIQPQAGIQSWLRGALRFRGCG